MEILIILVLVLLAIGCVMFYMLPVFIAMLRGHDQTVAIAATTLLLGWTGLFWLLALIWSFTNSSSSNVVIMNRTHYSN